MAELTLNPVFTGISGTIGRMVVYKWKNKTVARRHVVPRNPDTLGQRNNRGLFREAMKSWQSLGDEEKAAYNKKCARLSMTGHNLYISRYMRMHSAEQAISPSQDEIIAASGAFHAGTYSMFSHVRSVPAPSAPRFSVLSASVQRNYPPG
jgi:hypothetical protein